SYPAVHRQLFSGHIRRRIAYLSVCFFFFNPPPTTEIYTLSLHDALPISPIFTRRNIWRTASANGPPPGITTSRRPGRNAVSASIDRKSTRLNSSHGSISYAVFCLKKKKINTTTISSVTRTHY